MNLLTRLYIAKFLITFVWCYRGVGVLADDSRWRLPKAWVMAGWRMLVGGFVGLGVWAVFAMFGKDPYTMNGRAAWLAFESLSPALRWLVWGVPELILTGGRQSWRSILVGGTSDARRWRAWSLVASLVGDLPFILSKADLLTYDQWQGLV